MNKETDQLIELCKEMISSLNEISQWDTLDVDDCADVLYLYKEYKTKLDQIKK